MQHRIADITFKEIDSLILIYIIKVVCDIQQAFRLVNNLENPLWILFSLIGQSKVGSQSSAGDHLWASAQQTELTRSTWTPHLHPSAWPRDANWSGATSSQMPTQQKRRKREKRGANKRAEWKQWVMSFSRLCPQESHRSGLKQLPPFTVFPWLYLGRK